MTLLERTYTGLRDAGLVSCAEAFSRDYLGKNKNWYAFQTHTGREFSVAAAVQCLRSIRQTKRANTISNTQRQALTLLEERLSAHLSSKHWIAEVL